LGEGLLPLDREERGRDEIMERGGKEKKYENHSGGEKSLAERLS